MNMSPLRFFGDPALRVIAEAEIQLNQKPV